MVCYKVIVAPLVGARIETSGRAKAEIEEYCI